MSDTTARLEWRSRVLTLLEAWAQHAEQYWYPLPDALARTQEGLGCYGTGYNAWGVQTNQKYVSALAVLGVLGEQDGLASPDVCGHARARALAALRFSLWSHVSGDGACTDGTQWGHTWISGLGIERMMHGVYLLNLHMDDEDRAALQRVLVSEADWILQGYHRGGHRGVVGDVWNNTGRNAPESNLWNGALLWRTAMMYPDHAHAAAWQQEAHHFLVNGVSVPSDAADEGLVAGRPIREWHAGPNFFPSYALDHHGYLNVGYMFICLSNAAMLPFDMRRLGLQVPDSLYHHQTDLWHVARRLLFGDGRLARLGGDSRVRYAYCQEYALPSLLYAADALGEGFDGPLLAEQLDWIEQEAAYSTEGNPAECGSFYGRRLWALARQSPYYYTRLESDRACALGMTLAFLDLVTADKVGISRERGELRGGTPVGLKGFEADVAGTWCDPAHGVILHRCPSRLASFSWRAHGLAQGMCQPPDDGHLAEWSYNLCGLARFQGDDGLIEGGQTRHRRLLRHEVQPFEGGFATWGAIAEGTNLQIAEGWHGDRAATHQIALVALPDKHTVVGLQFCRTDAHRTYAVEVKGLHLCLPNDLFNGFYRQLGTASGEIILRTPVDAERVMSLESSWLSVEDRVGFVRLYGDENLVIHRSPERRGGRFASLYVEQICLGCETGLRSLEPGETIIDCGWAVLSGLGSEQTATCAHESMLLDVRHADVRGVRVRGRDRWYAILANWSDHMVSLPAGVLCAGAQPDFSPRDLLHGLDVSWQDHLVLLRGQVAVLALGST